MSLLNRSAILCLETLVDVLALRSLWVPWAKRIHHCYGVKFINSLFYEKNSGKHIPEGTKSSVGNANDF